VQQEPKFNLTRQEDAGRQLAQSSQAEGARAAIESAYTIAFHRPRSVQQVRQTLLQACDRNRFAETALWTRRIGGDDREGLSIRFAETALQAWGNVRVSSETIYDDDKVRKVSISVLDLETNISYSKEVTLEKTAEKTKVWGDMEVISKRTNSEGNLVFLVRATEHDLTNKVGAIESKVIRNAVLRLIPQDILEECKDRMHSTLSESHAENRDGKIRALADAFRNECGVSVKDLEAFLGHQLSGVSSKEYVSLRGIFAAIRDGQAVWADFVQPASSKLSTDRPVLKLEQLKARQPDAAPLPATAQKTPPPAPPPAPVPAPAPAAQPATPPTDQEQQIPRKRGRPRKEQHNLFFPTGDQSAPSATAFPPDLEPVEQGGPQEKFKDDPVYQEMVRTWEWKALTDAYHKHCGPELPKNASSGGLAAAILEAKLKARGQNPQETEVSAT
jgi:hypothetical protein